MNNETKHTPGPWLPRNTPNDTDFAGSIETEAGDSVAEVYSARDLAFIASAPDMAARIEQLEAEKAELLATTSGLLSIIDSLRPPGAKVFDEERELMAVARAILAKHQPNQQHTEPKPTSAS